MKLNMFKSKPKQILGVAAIVSALFTLPVVGYAQSYTITNTASGSFLSGANPTLNYGGAGTFAVASASLSKGEYDTVLMFNTAAAFSQFNTAYGAGNWTITGVTLSLASNFGTNGATPGSQFNTVRGGNFNIDWLSDNSWVGGSGGGMGGTGYPNNSSVSYAYEPTLLSFPYDSLGTFTYTPPGNNTYANYALPLDANLLANASAGGEVSLYFTPADNQISYLFNTPKFGSNFPEFTLDVSEVPEPGTLALLATGLGGYLISRRQKRKS